MNVIKELAIAMLIASSLASASHTVPNITDFAEYEWFSSQCDHYLMDVNVMHHIQVLRDYMNQPLTITSAYRCNEHTIEAAKIRPGQHSKGLAVDIYVSSDEMAAKMIAFAIDELNVKGYAYSKHGKFVHLDWRTGDMVTWKY